jgi:hypothetical protein
MTHIIHSAPPEIILEAELADAELNPPSKSEARWLILGGLAALAFLGGMALGLLEAGL